MLKQHKLSSLPATMVCTLILMVAGVASAAADWPPGFHVKSGLKARSVINVNCNDNPDALLKRYNGWRSGSNTTFEISGACNGPLYVTADGVHLVGVDENAAIVLPGPPADPSNGAVFGDGAHDLRIQNLLIDASAWSTGAIAKGSDAAGVYARNAFVRIIDSRIVGGQWSINPFRNAVVRTEGLVELIDFVNSGISVGDQSVVTARGHVHLGSAVTDGDYLNAVELYRTGGADFRRGVTIEVPPADQSSGFYPQAIAVYRQSHLRIRNGGTVDIGGRIHVDTLGSVIVDGGIIAGNVDVNGGSAVRLRNLLLEEGDLNVETGGILQLSGVDQGDGEIRVGQNAVLNTDQSEIGYVAGYLDASIRIEGGSVNGVELRLGSLADISGASVTGDIGLFRPSSINIFQEGEGSLNGNTVYLCGVDPSYIDPLLISPPDGTGGPGFVSDECLP